MDVELKGEDFAMFKENAKVTLEKHVAEYALQLKNEAERVALSRSENKEDAKVSDSIVNSIIGIHGHYIFKKTDFIFTYLLPVGDAICGSVFASMLCLDDKKWWHGAIMAGAFAMLVFFIILRYIHDSKK